MMILFSMLLRFSGNYQNSPNNSIKLLTTAKNVWLDFGASAVGFFESYTFKEILFTLKTISLILSLLFLAGIIFVIWKTMCLGGSVKKMKKNPKRWMKIEKRLKSGQEANCKLAILEADAFYDDNLKAVGYEKEKGLSDIDEIKMAKNVKRRIIDNKQYILTREEAEKSVYAYKKGLQELGAI